MIFLMLLLIIPYLVPGLFLARGIYSEQIREIRSKPITIVPPKPKRPQIKVSELLHDSSSIKKCSILLDGKRACNCRSRDEWIELKNAWMDYQDWCNKYARLENGVERMPEPDMAEVYMAVPFWPIYMVGMFIKGGVKNIPDFREIERLERSVGIDPLRLN